MPSGWESYAQAVAADGPVAWYRFDELLAGQAVTAGGQDPQNFCFDSSIAGNLNRVTPPFANGNYLQYGSAVTGNAANLASPIDLNGAGGWALFPSTGTLSTANIITGGTNQPAILQPTAAITLEAWVTPNVISGSSQNQVILCYGSAAAALQAYDLLFTGTTAVNAKFYVQVNTAGTLRTLAAPLPLIVTGALYHVVGVYSGTALTIYVNGGLQGTAAYTGAISYASTGGYGLAMGNDPSLSYANVQSYINEVAIYNYALSASRIAYHYRQGSTYLPFSWNH